jgi:hypothetical protein
MLIAVEANGSKTKAKLKKKLMVRELIKLAITTASEILQQTQARK